MPYLQTALGSFGQTLIGLYLIAVMLRFLFQLLRIDFRNPLVQTIVTITNPPMRFLRRFIPGLYGIDLTAVFLIVLLGLVKLTLPFLMVGHEFQWSGALVLSIADSLDSIMWIFLLAVLAHVVASWVAPRSHHPALQIVIGLSEPIMAPFRRILPSFGGLDFSPIATLLCLRLAQQLLLQPLTDFGVMLF